MYLYYLVPRTLITIYNSKHWDTLLHPFPIEVFPTLYRFQLVNAANIYICVCVRVSSTSWRSLSAHGDLCLSLTAHYFVTVWMSHSLFNQSPIARLLDCFQSFAMTNSAAADKGVIGHFAFVQVYLKAQFPEVSLLSQRALWSPPEGLTPFAFLPANALDGLSPTAPPARSVSALSIFANLVGEKW